MPPQLGQRSDGRKSMGIHLRKSAFQLDVGNSRSRDLIGLYVSSFIEISRLAVDMDIHGYIHGYIHVWISDLGHAVDISMDIWYRYFIVNIANSI